MPLNSIFKRLDPITTKPKTEVAPAQVTKAQPPPVRNTQAPLRVQDGFDSANTTRRPTAATFNATNGRTFNSRDGVPLFNQGDREWGSRQLGTARNGTLANRGCAITASAMAVSAMTGRTITPAQMDQFLDRTHSYAGNSVNFQRVGDVAGVDATRRRNFSVNQLNSELDAGRPVVIGVDYRSGRGTDHWMTVTGRNADGTYNVNDPNGGRAIRMAVRNGALVSADQNSMASRGRTYRFDGNAVTFRG